MRYFLVPDINKARLFSELIYRVMYPQGADVQTVYLFEVIDNGTSAVICIPDNYVCPVFVKSDFNTVIDQIAVQLGLNNTQKNALRNKLQAASSCILADIIPSKLTEVNKQYLIDNNYIDATLP